MFIIGLAIKIQTVELRKKDKSTRNNGATYKTKSLNFERVLCEKSDIDPRHEYDEVLLY